MCTLGVKLNVHIFCNYNNISNTAAIIPGSLAFPFFKGRAKAAYAGKSTLEADFFYGKSSRFQ